MTEREIHTYIYAEVTTEQQRFKMLIKFSYGEILLEYGGVAGASADRRSTAKYRIIAAKSQCIFRCVCKRDNEPERNDER